MDITQHFSDSTNELLQRAARRAMERGSLDLTNEHLLFAALEDGTVRRVLQEVDADPDAIRAQPEEESEGNARVDLAPSLAPDAKRALLAAHGEPQALGASYVGPEHVLLALAADEESEAGGLLSRFGLSHTKLRGRSCAAAKRAARLARSPVRPRRSTSSTAATSPRWPARASSTPSSASSLSGSM